MITLEEGNLTQFHSNFDTTDNIINISILINDSVENCHSPEAMNHAYEEKGTYARIVLGMESACNHPLQQKGALALHRKDVRREISHAI